MSKNNPKNKPAGLSLSKEFLQEFNLDTQAVEKGKQFSVGQFTFTLAHLGQGNPRYMEALFQAGDKIKNPATKEAKDANIKIFAEISLLAWDVKDDAGKDIPCTTANKIKLLTEYPYFLEQLTVRAMNQRNYTNIDAAGITKN